MHHQEALYLKAISYRDGGKKDSAFIYFNKSKEIFLQKRDSLNAGKCLVNMAIISTDQGDYFGGQELSLSASGFFDPKNSHHHVYIESNFNNLGIASFNLKNYDQAVVFYKQSLAFTTDSANQLVVKNNIANAYREEKDYPKAISIYQEILKAEKNPANLARVLSNLAYTKWLYQKIYPVKGLKQALTIRENENDVWGQNSSYAQLSDYYLEKQPDSALFYAEKMYQTAKVLNLPDERLEALRKLVKVSDPQSTQFYFSLYRNLEDSLQTARSAAKNQFALIRFETEKHKAEKLELQKENTIRNICIGVLVLILFSVIILVVLWNKKRKERLRLETLNLIKESELKTSKKVHDVVANGLYRLMSEIENGKNLNQDRLLDHMETLYEQSRDISYENNIDFELPFEQQLKTLLSSFATHQTKVVILGNTADIWANVEERLKYELKNILQELLVNMKKHSKASYVAIRFEQLPHLMNIYYSDNGVGIPKKKIFGNGLKNTGNRINDIGGTINFGDGEGGGLKIQITFPIN